MKLLPLLLVSLTAASCVNGFYKGGLLQPTSRSLLFVDREHHGIIESWQNETSGQVGRTVWQVVFREDGGKLPKPLFTVEQIRGEKTPAHPEFASPWDEPLLSDFSSKEYQYSIPRRKFIKLTRTEQIYLGGYRVHSGARRNPFVEMPMMLPSFSQH